MIVDRFESDARRISRGSMLDKDEDGAVSRQHHPRKASHQPPRSPRLLPKHGLLSSGQRSHNDLMLLSPGFSSANKSSKKTSFVESVRKSSFSSKMAEIFDGDSSPSTRLPDGDSQIFRLYVFGPSDLKDYGSATLRCKI